MRQRFDERAGHRVVGINGAVAKITHGQIATDIPKSCRRQRQSPGRIQGAVGNQTAQKVALQIERVHDAVARSSDIIVFGPVLYRIRHVQNTAEILYAERRISGGQIRVRKGAGQVRRSTGSFHYVDRIVAEVSQVRVLGAADVRIGESLVNVGGAPRNQSLRRGSQIGRASGWERVKVSWGA